MYDVMVESLMRSFAYEALYDFAEEHGIDTDLITEEYLVEQLNKWKDG
jgi:hypothetical protein|tara:strand:- start:1165 stop:1308 length:144 start_codon:yes stop_codon:yes gene_type:complete